MEYQFLKYIFFTKSYFSSENIFYSVQTRTTRIENNIFLIKTPVLIGAMKIIVQNPLPIRFVPALKRNNISKVSQ